jgi:hypothetical protein
MHSESAICFQFPAKHIHIDIGNKEIVWLQTEASTNHVNSLPRKGGVIESRMLELEWDAERI